MDRWHLEKCYNNLFCFVFFIVYGRYAMLLNSLFVKTCVNVTKRKKGVFFNVLICFPCTNGFVNRQES